AVSLIHLIANPEKYERKIVQLIGYVHLDRPPTHEETSDGVFLSSLDWEYGISHNGLYLAVPVNSPVRDAFEDDYMIVEGQFLHNPGHMMAWSGTLVEIQRLEKCPPAKDHSKA